ncbi:MAG: protoporphyrinogen oxidase [Gemmatimonadales bacterium]|nr:protoporphyrinogen oxidase [Gemmatimonadales bacterium]
MNPILVIYGTTDGHTKKLAYFLSDALQQTGARVDVVRAGKDAIDPDPNAYSGIVVAGSVHAGGYQRPLRRWVGAHAEALGHRPAVFLSVCLGVLQDDPAVAADLDRIMHRFFTQTGWHPAMTKTVAGALPYSRYGIVKRWVMRRMARKAGVETDPHQDYEYTDWDDLRLFARGFSSSVRAAAPIPFKRPTQVAEATI